MKHMPAAIVGEYGPFPGVDAVHGVSFDGQSVWFASGDALHAFDPGSGELVHALNVPAHAGTAFDGTHLYQIADAVIRKIGPATGAVLSTIPVPGDGGNSGLAWAEGALWVGRYHERRIHQIDPDTGAVLRTIELEHFVTGVTWFDQQLWHGSWKGQAGALRHVDAETGEVLECLEMPPGTGVSGLEADGAGQFFCGGGSSRKVKVVRRP